MNSLFYSYDRQIENTYIITLPGNENSERLTKRCQDSCERVEQKYKLWQAYDGIKDVIVEPEHLKNSEFIKLLKVSDHYLTRGEVACALSHISLWVHCVKLDKPIVILEHDALMLKKFTHHDSYNSIVFLGSAEWVEKGWPITNIPPHGTDGHNKHFICRAHAYSIDPQIAKNLLSHVLKMGICDPLDIMLRADLFSITHNGVYAYDKSEPTNTTIKGRPTGGRTTKRNDQLSY